jgi:hypothetical protein
MVTNEQGEHLWQMDAHAFNEWRAKNDLPHLFDFFKRILPGFDAWLETLPFDSDITLRVVPTGELFKGRAVKTVIEDVAPQANFAKIRCMLGDATAVTIDLARSHSAVKIHGSFEPYFLWAKRTLKRSRFISRTGIKFRPVDTFYFGLWGGDLDGSSATSAHLFREFRVLKLGQIVLEKNVSFDGRNLDFTDLDYLTVTGMFHGNTMKTINYSSCRFLTFKDASVFFYAFYACAFSSVTFDSSKIQDVYIDEGGWGTVYLTDSEVYRFGIENSPLTPVIRGCELRDFRYRPSNEVPPSAVSRLYRTLRAAYQAIGLRREASDAYYRERVFERKSFYLPFVEYAQYFSGVILGGSYSTPINDYRKGVIDAKAFWGLMWRVFAGRAAIYFKPRELLHLARFRLKWLASLGEWLLWGYGEKPARIMAWMALLIVGYASAYHYLPWPTIAGKDSPQGWMDDFYFSAVTFTTLGYGDIAPTSGALKLVCASEALLGALSLGLFVAGFSNRSKY